MLDGLSAEADGLALLARDLSCGRPIGVDLKKSVPLRILPYEIGAIDLSVSYVFLQVRDREQQKGLVGGQGEVSEDRRLQYPVGLQL